MRVGQFTDSYFPILNGISTFIRAYNRTLVELGHEPHVFTFGHTRHGDSEPRIHRSPGLPLGRTGYRAGLTHTRRVWAVAETMDVLHAHHPFQCGWLAARLSRRTRKPLIFTNHTRYDYYAHHYLPFLPRRAALSVLGAWMRRFARQCDLIIAVSASVQAMLTELGVTAPIEIIPNGTDLDRFQNARPMSRSELGLPDDAAILMYVGRLGPEKNLLGLLDAFGQARRRVPAAVLAVVGDGPFGPAVRAHAGELSLGDSVRFLGMRPNDQVPSILSAADAFVTASVTEGHPMAIIEALAAGRPVLACDVPGIRETIADGENGLLSPVNMAALGERMARLAADVELRARLSDGARRSASHYSMDATAGRIVDHYQRLLREKRGPGGSA